MKNIISPLEYLLIIFDADGTLRRCKDKRQVCPNKNDEWEVIPGVKEVIDRYREDRQRRINNLNMHIESTQFAIASNQGGIGLGYVTIDDAWGMLENLYKEVFPSTADMLITLCPHTERDSCFCRKPNPGMIYNIVNYVNNKDNLRRYNVLFVGDMESDRQAAEKAGIRFMWAKDFFGREE